MTLMSQCSWDTTEDSEHSMQYLAGPPVSRRGSSDAMGPSAWSKKSISVPDRTVLSAETILYVEMTSWKGEKWQYKLKSYQPAYG